MVQAPRRWVSHVGKSKAPDTGGCRGFGFRLGGTTTGEGQPRLCVYFITPVRVEKLQISQLRGFSVAGLTMAPVGATSHFAVDSNCSPIFAVFGRRYNRTEFGGTGKVLP